MSFQLVSLRKYSILAGLALLSISGCNTESLRSDSQKPPRVIMIVIHCCPI